MLRAASSILRRTTFKPFISKTTLGSSNLRRGFSSLRTGGINISLLNGAMFGIGTAGLMYLIVVDRKPSAA